MRRKVFFYSIASFLFDTNLVYSTEFILRKSAGSDTIENTTRAFKNVPIKSFLPITGSELGDTLVSIEVDKERYHGDFKNLSCCFDDILVSANQSNADSISCHSPPHEPGVISFHLTSGDSCLGVDEYQTAVGFQNFTYTIMATVFSIEPVVGNHGTVVTVTGSGFRKGSSLLCRFGDVPVLAEFLSDSQIECICPLISPSNENNEPIIISVSNNGVDIEGFWADVMFYYVKPPLFSQIEPSSIPSSRGSTLFIRGYHFRHIKIDRISSYCKIGEVVVEANVLSDDEVACVISHVGVISSDFVSVSLSVDGGFNFYTNDLLTVYVHLDVTLTSVQPPVISERGGTSLQVYGENIPRNDQLACLFDDMAVTAIWISGSLVECIAPEGRVGAISLRLSTNGQLSGITEGVFVTYLSDPVVSAISPAVGPTEGGTLISIHGHGLSAHPIFLCRFGDLHAYEGMVINETLASCEIPRVKRASIVPLYISVNGGHEYTTTGLMFRYFERARMNRVEPNTITAIGGNSVIIYGNFGDISYLDVKCRFKSKSMTRFGDVVDRSGDKLVCATPSLSMNLIDGLETMSVDVVLVDSDDTSATETSLSIVIFSDMIVRKVSPAYGSELGGTKVTITGVFPRTGSLSCAFDNNTSPHSEWINSNTIICTTPPAVGNILASPMVDLSVSLNEKDFQSISTFKYVPAMHIAGFEPSSGPRTGGTELKIWGEGFFADYAQAFCIINGSFELAILHNSTFITCRTPPVNKAGMYYLEISFNGESFIRSDTFFKFYEVPRIVRVMPSTVSIRDHTQVRIFGENFNTSETVLYRIRNAIIRPHTRNESEMLIVTPIFDVAENFTEYLEISLNGIDFQSSGKMLQFVEPPSISEVEPPFIHESRNMTIKVIGKGFFMSNLLSCVLHTEYQRIPSPVSYLTSEVVECSLSVFQQRLPGIVSVSISSFGQVLASDPKVSLSVLREILISAVEPPLVPITGVSRIFIIGQGFDQGITLFCLFQIQNQMPFRSKAIVESDEVLSCIAPSFQFSSHVISDSTIELLGEYGNERYYILSNQSDQFPVRVRFYKEATLAPSESLYVDSKGNLNITVIGENFISNDLLKCVFCFEDLRLDVKANFITSSYVECEAPDVQMLLGNSKRIKSMLLISNNGINFSSEFLSVHHFSFQLESLSLDEVFEDSVTNITVYGSNFFEDSTLKCEINGVDGRHLVTLAYYQSPFHTICVIPELTFGSYALTIGTKSVFSVNALKFVARANPIINHIEPSNGPIEGGTLVTLQGYNFAKTSEWLCSFGYEMVRAIWHSEERVACLSPAVDQAISIHISLTVNVQFVNEKGPIFHYIPRPDIHSVSPYQGEFITGSDIIIRGINMHSPFAETSVLFGNVLISPRVSFDDMLTITVPEGMEVEPELECIPLFVSLNQGHDLSKPGPCLIVSKQPIILDIVPKFGLVVGGNTVTLYGENFSYGSSYKCRFGTNEVRAQVISSSLIECIAPFSSYPGDVVVQISTDNMVWTDGNCTYTYEIPMDIYRVAPPVLMTHDRTLLHFTGENIPQSRSLNCQFEDFGRSSIIKLSDAEFTCISPPLTEEGSINLSIVSEDVAITRTAVLQLQYRHPSYWRISTTFGPVQGGTVLHTDIADLGMGPFNDTIFSYFLFENSNYLSVPVTILNSTSVRFATPDISLLSIDEIFVHSKIVIGIGRSRNDSISKPFSTPLYFTFKKSPTNCQILPNVSDYNGGIDIHITGEASGGFWLNSSTLLCRFGTTDVTARWITPHRINCKVPPIQSNKEISIPVSVSDNGENFISVGTFTYIDNPRIKWIEPRYVVHGHETNIIINSFNLDKFSDISCCFETSAGTVFDSLSVFNSTHGSCNILMDLDSDSGNVSLSTDGKTCSAETVEITSLQPISSDFISPTRLPLNKSSVIHFRGLFPQNLPFQCRLKLDEHIIHGNFQIVSKNLAVCNVICYASFAWYTIDILYQDVILLSYDDIHCDPMPVLMEFESNILMNSNTSSVSVRGHSFRDTDSLSCSFRHSKGVIYSGALFHDPQKIMCLVPQIDTTLFEISVSNNGHHYSEGLQIETFDDLFVISVAPMKSMIGGTIYFEGEFQNQMDRISCLIDKSALRIIVIHPRKLTCKIPSNLSVGRSHQVQLLLDHKWIIPGSEKDIFIHALPQVQNIVPSSGLRDVKTSITVYGKNFDTGSNAWCQFGVKRSEAFILANDIIECIVPRATKSGLVQFTLNYNDQIVRSVKDLFYEYYDLWVINSLSPRLGHLEGGTKVSITGRGFNEGISTLCRFGTKVSSAIILSDEYLICTSPRQPYPGNVMFRLETQPSLIQNVSYSLIRHAVDFFIIDSFRLSALIPNRGYVHGTTVVEIFGSWNVEDVNEELLTPACKFGDRVVPGNFSRQRRSIFCTSPPALVFAKSAVMLSISLNGVDFCEGLVFTYDVPVQVLSIQPSRGYSTGGTLVKMVLSNHSSIESSISCRFGEMVSPTVYYDQSQRSIYCVSPKAQNFTSVSVLLQISSDSEWFDTGFVFTFQNEIVIHSFDPKIFSEDGGDELNIRGEGFRSLDGINCRIGNVTVEPTAVYQDSLVCKMPPVKALKLGPGLQLSVTLTVNGEEFLAVPGSSQITFRSKSSLFRISPSFGPSNSITNLELKGSDFALDVPTYCLFNHKATVARVLSETTIFCDASPLFIGDKFFINVNVTVLQSKEIIGPPQIYTYFSSTKMMHMDLIPRLGPLNRPFSVQLSSPFLQKLLQELPRYHHESKILIKLGDTITNATFHGPDEISFHVDRIKVNATFSQELLYRVPLSVSFNEGQHYHPLPALQLYSDPVIHRIEPPVIIHGIHESIIIHGSNFPDSKHVRCALGHAKVYGERLTASMIRCSIPHAMMTLHREMFLSISLAYNGNDFIQLDNDVYIANEPTFLKSSTRYLSNAGGTNITIFGSGFINLDSSEMHYGCIYDKIPKVDSCFRYHVINDTELSLSIPNLADEKDVFLYIQNSHGLNLPTNIQFRQLRDLNVTGIHTVYTNDSDNIRIDIYGDFSDAEHSFSCVIKSHDDIRIFVTDAIIDSKSSTLICYIEERGLRNNVFYDLNNIFITILRQDDGYESKKFKIIHEDRFLVRSIHPKSLFWGVTQTVTITGSFEEDQHAELFCVFLGHDNKYTVMVSYKEPSQVMCKSPSNLGSDLYHVSILNRASGRSSSSFPVNVSERNRIVGMNPNRGYLSGGTPVIVAFENLLQNTNDFADVICLFGRKIVIAMVSGHELTCIAPSWGSLGEVPFQVSARYYIRNNEYEYVTFQQKNENMSFTYVDKPQISSVLPAILSGQTASYIFIEGQNFGPVPFVRFDLIESNFTKVLIESNPIKTVNGLLVKFKSLESHFASIIVSVSSDGSDFIRYSRRIPVLSMNTITVSHAYPTVVIERCNFNFTIFGVGFEESLYCRFEGVNTKVHRLTNTEIFCPISIDAEPGTYAVSLVRDDFSGVSANLMIQVQPAFKIASIHPTIGPSRGGTKVFIKGTGFKPLQNKLSCKFGSFRSGLMQVLNDTSGICLSPSLNEIQDIDVSKHVGSINTQFSLEFEPSHFNSCNSERRDNNTIFSFYNDEVLDSVQPVLIPHHGSIVQVHGNGFANTSLLACRVGNVKVIPARYLSNRTITCIIPSMDNFIGIKLESSLYPVSVSISVSNNGVDFVASEVISVLYYHEPEIIHVDPLAGLPGTEVFITANASFPSHLMYCRFGSFVLNSTKVLDNVVSCRAPRELFIADGQPSAVELALSVNQKDYMTIGTFTFTGLPTITKIIPSYGSVHGHYEALVYGTNFDLIVPEIFCKFDESLSPAIVLSAHALTCVVPPQDKSNTVKVDLFSLQNYSLISDSEVTFEYVDNFYISSIQPTFGTTQGGTLISIAGENFSQRLGLSCIFGNNMWTNATVISPSQVTCTAPASLNTDAMIVTVKLGTKHHNGITFLTSKGVMYQYTFAPEIHYIYPSRAMASGGDHVMIFGSNFTYPGSSETVDCAFGDVLIKGKWISTETIKCVTPTVPVSFTKREVHVFEVRQSKGELLDCSEVHFFLEFENESSRVLSCNASELDVIEALQELSTVGLVEVTRNNPQDDIDVFVIAYCITFTTLGNPANAGPLDPIRIHLLSSIDGISVHSWVFKKACCDIKISVNGIDYHQGRDNAIVSFTFDEHIFVHSIAPSHGPMRGGTELTVHGVGIPNPYSQNSQVYCVIGGVFVTALYVDSSRVRCKTPAFAEPVSVTVSIAINSKAAGMGKIIESLAVFEYILDPTVITSFPKTLPRTPSRWTKLEIYGENFVYSDQLKCRFERWDYDESMKRFSFETSANFIRNDVIHCVLVDVIDLQSIHDTVLYASITTNGYDFSNSIPITIIDHHTLLSLYPSQGTIDGGTKVYIDGTNFIKSDELACKFGHRIVPGIFVSSDGIICVSPAANQSDLTLEVTVTTDGYHFSDNSMLFSYYEGGTILMIDPNVGPSSGGTKVTIYYQASETIASEFQCGFNNTLVRAEAVGLDILQCYSPSANNSGGMVRLAIYRNGVEMTGKDNKFLYLPTTRSEALIINPNHGPDSGGTAVRVTGIPLSWSENYAFTGKCRFDEVIVNASIARDDPESIICVSPIKATESVVFVDVSLTGAIEDFTDIGAIYTYDDSISVFELKPNYGSVSGNTDVIIHGGTFPQYYHSETLCIFGDQVVTAKWLNQSNIVCKSPPLPPAYEVQNMAIYSMAWNYAVQTISISYDDYTPEIHSIYTFTNVEMKEEIQRMSIEILENKEKTVYRIEASTKMDNSIEIDVQFQPSIEMKRVMILRSFVKKNCYISGGFELFIEQFGAIVSSGILPYDISAEQLKDTLSHLDDSLADLDVDEIETGLDGTRKWKISISSRSNVVRLQVNGNSLLGEGSGINLHTESTGLVEEIQKISLLSFSKQLYGNFSIGFKEYWTEPIAWDADADSLSEILEQLPSIGQLSISHSSISFFNDQGIYKSDWIITFLTYTGNAPLLRVCCDSSSDTGRQSIHASEYNDDIQISITELQRGEPENDGEDSFQIRFYGRRDGFLATRNIPLQAASEFVVHLIEESGFVKGGKTEVVKTFVDEENNLPRFKIKFELLSSEMSRILPSEILSVEILSNSESKVAEYSVTSYFVSKPMYSLEFLANSGIISCADDVGQFSFSSHASNETILESIKGNFFLSDESTSFDIVTLLETSVVKQVIITNIAVRGSLDCGKDVIVRRLDKGQSPNIIGGNFTISMNGDKNNILTIPYNISNENLENLFGSYGWTVSVSSEQHEAVGRSWLITFLDDNTSTSVALETMDLIGYHPMVHIQLLDNIASVVNESYRIKVQDQWTSPILITSNSSIVEKAVNALNGVHVKIEDAYIEGFEYSFFFHFLGYVGNEPHGFIPASAGNIPSIVVSSTTSKLNFNIETLQNGTDPLRCYDYSRCFRLLAPNADLQYASTDSITKWLSHNESAEGMKVALERSINCSNIVVDRIGPYRNGTYEWRVILPASVSFERKTWQVVRDEGLSPRFVSIQSNVSTTLLAMGIAKLGGYFQLQYNNTRDGVIETTNKIFLNSSSIDIKRELELLPSIGNVNVSSAFAADSERGTFKWEIVFLSLRNAGYQPLLKIVSDNLEGGNIKAAVESNVKGESNTVYMIRMRHTDSFKIYLEDWVSNLISDPTAEMVAAELFQMSGHNFLVERNEDGDFLFLYILSLSYAVSDGSLGVITSCALDEKGLTNDKCTGDYSIAEVWKPKSTGFVDGNFSLIYNTLNDSDLNISSCTEETKPLSFWSSPSEIESALEELYLIKDVKVSVKEGTPLKGVTSGKIGTIRHFRIEFRDAQACGETMNLNSYSDNDYQIPLLRVIWSSFFGASSYEPISLQPKSHFVEREIVTPNHGTPVSVGISFNGQNFYETKKAFLYIPKLEVIRIHPNKGTQGTVLMLESQQPIISSELFCYFKYSYEDFHDVIRVPIENVLQQGPIACKVPAPPQAFNRKGFLHVYLGVLDGFDDDSSYQSFMYEDPLVISHVFPMSGPSSGDFTITIQGGPFSFSDETLCKIGSTVVSANVISANKLTCISPKQNIGSHKLTISRNGQDFSRHYEMITFFDDVKIESLFPSHGPFHSAGTTVIVKGTGFVSTGANLCRFGNAIVPATVISADELLCETPILDSDRHLERLALSSHVYKSYIENKTMPVFPYAHDYPSYLAVQVPLQVSMNGQDYVDTRLPYVYQDDIFITSIANTGMKSSPGTAIFLQGFGFVNSTKLSCRFGKMIVNATFLTRELIFCVVPVLDWENSGSVTLPLEASNNGADFSNSRVQFTYESSFSHGEYNQGINRLKCPRGTFCNRFFHHNFTMCPKGTYQTQEGQNECTRCPIGFICPEEGLPNPRICPAGYVCDIMGLEMAEQPCPPGFHCEEGTASSSTVCYNRAVDGGWRSTATQDFETDDVHHTPADGRKSLCFDNSTHDFGLQMSVYPARFWDEWRTLPLDVTPKSSQPNRGRFCLPEECQHIDSGIAVNSNDTALLKLKIRLKRPRPCPRGTYCHAGTTSDKSMLHDLTKPQPCGNGSSCAEASSNPKGIDECPPGFYCRFGLKFPCKVGTYCPTAGLFDPIPCEPGTFNYMVGQISCTICPIGHFCPGYGRIEPTLCTPGFVCSEDSLSSPNIMCPAGFYCPIGTQTSDPFRNDTTLRPYPCPPGTYCLSGTGMKDMVEGNFSHPQPCIAGFYCESGTPSARGTGICPSGFFCPKGSSVPLPTPKGHFTKYEGSIEPTVCLPGFYAPTIENKECFPCPPGAECLEEGLSTASLCPPGTYRGSLEDDGVSCLNCPQGSWSQNWNARDEGECISCPTGVTCPLEGTVSPCSRADLPSPFEPVVNLNGVPILEYLFPPDQMPPEFSMDECLELNGNQGKKTYHFGELIPPYIDILGRGPHFRPSDELSIKYGKRAKCYVNLQPKGSIVYQRSSIFFGPQYDIATGNLHQGYGLNNNDDTKHGIGYIPLLRHSSFRPQYNCTPGFSLMNSTLVRKEKQIVYTSKDYDYEGGADVKKCPVYDYDLKCFVDPSFQMHERGECCEVKSFNTRAIFIGKDQFYPGTCEADIICTNDEATEAVPCQEGYVCGERTTSSKSKDLPCALGFICEFGTTPDESLEAPYGQYKTLCPQGFFCPGGVGTVGRDLTCPKDYYCPAGTGNPFLGTLADDAIVRRNHLDTDIDDSIFRYRNLVFIRDLETFHLQNDHDYFCQFGNEDNINQRYDMVLDVEENDNQLIHGSKQIFMSRGIRFRNKCARDSKWRHVQTSLRRNECKCHAQLYLLAALYRFWKVRLLMHVSCHRK